jgi:hypothetical protein
MLTGLMVEAADSPVYVTDNSYGCADVDYIRLPHKDLFRFLAYFAEESLVKELFAEKLLYACIQIEGGHADRQIPCLHLFARFHFTYPPSTNPAHLKALLFDVHKRVN